MDAYQVVRKEFSGSLYDIRRESKHNVTVWMGPQYSGNRTGLIFYLKPASNTFVIYQSKPWIPEPEKPAGPKVPGQ